MEEENINAGEGSQGAGGQDNGAGGNGGNGSGEEAIKANDPFAGYTEPSKQEELKDEELESLDPEERDVVQKIIDAKMSGVNQTVAQIKRDQDLSNLYSGEYGDVYKVYDADIRKALADPRAEGMTVQSLADKIVPKSAFIRAGAERARLSDKKARMSRSGAGRARGGSGSKDAMFTQANTPQARQQLADKILSGEVKIFEGSDD